MRDIDDEQRAEFMCKRLQCSDVWRVGVHREHAFGDQQDGVLCVFRADALQLLSRVIGIEVATEVNVFGGRIRALLQAVVR